MAKSQSDSATSQNTTSYADSFNTAYSYAATLDQSGNVSVNFADMKGGQGQTSTLQETLIPVAVVGVVALAAMLMGGGKR